MYHCPACEILTTIHAIYNIPDGSQLCSQCFNNHGWQLCDRCETAHNESEECPVCRSDEEESLMRWDYREDWNFFKTERDAYNPTFFGCEIEMEATSSRWPQCISSVGKKSDWHFLKGDGSLDSYGTEMCLHPMTYDFMKSNPQYCTDRLLQARSAGYRAEGRYNCGMHVHVNRGSFHNDEHIVKFSNYMIGKVARAISERECHYWDSSSSYCKETKTWMNGGNCIWSNDRYVACNTGPDETVEVRFFQSTLNPKKFLKNVEYCMAGIELAKGDWPKSFDKSMVAYTMNNPNYPYLNEFYQGIL